MDTVRTVEREWRTVQEAAGWREKEDRAKLEVFGPDAVEFLQNMLSNDVSGLSEGTGCYAVYLTATGKMVSDLYCYRLRDRLLLDLNADRALPTRQTLEKFVIMEEVEIRDVTAEIAHFSLHGPRADSFLSRVLGTETPEETHRIVESQWQGLPLRVARRGELHPVGFELFLPRGLREALREALGKEGIPEIALETEEILRVEAGVPRFGVDMDENRYPMEARLDSALSLTKGCYIGQEVVARATHIGGVSRLLSKLVPVEDSPLEAGSLLLDGSGRRAGRVTSAVDSLRFRSTIGLGYVKRALASPGTRLGLETPDGRKGTVEVVDDFPPAGAARGHE